MLDGEHGRHQFEAAAATQRMAVRRLGGRHGDMIGPLAKDGADGFGLDDVVCDGARTVGIDVIDGIPSDAGIVKGGLDGGASAGRVRA